MVEEASRQPITQENIAKQLGKLGDSHFHLAEAIEIRVSDNAFYPLKAINELRRRGLTLLEEQVILANGFSYERTSEKDPDTVSKEGSRKEADQKAADQKETAQKVQKEKEKWAITLRTPEQWQGFCASAFSKNPVIASGPIRLYLDADFLLQDKTAANKMFRELSEKEIYCMIALPKILRLRDEPYLEKLQQLLQENLEFIQGFQAASMEHIELLKQ